MVTLVDASPVMLDAARHRAGEDRRFAFVLAPADRLPIPDDSVDVVVSQLGLGSNLDETRRAEVTVEGQCLPEALAAHDDEARGIDERVDPLVVAPEPGPRLALDPRIDLHDRKPVRGLDRVEEPDCRNVAVATAKERPGLTDDVVRRQQRLAGRPQADRVPVVGITSQAERHPVGGVDKPHEP